MQPPKALRMPETEETTEEFVSAELEMLAMGAKGIPPSSSLGALARERHCTLRLLVRCRPLVHGSGHLRGGC